MSKVKTNGKKITPAGESLRSDQKDRINLEEKIDKLTIKTKSVNGLSNGVEHVPNKVTKKNRRNSKNANKNPERRNRNEGDKNDQSVVDVLDEVAVASEKCISPDRLEGASGISDKTRSDTSDLKLKKSKNKRTDLERPSCSSVDTRSKTDDLDLTSDFDITAYIKEKYGSEICSVDEKLLEKDPQLDKKLEETTESSDLETLEVTNPTIEYIQYESELQMPMIMKIIQKDLSEPYSIYTYRYFIHNWPNLCFLAMCEGECVGAIVCKLDLHRKQINRGYIAMLAVDKKYRKHGIGSTLVKRAIQEMIEGNADEVVLETEITNKPALRLYEALGFVRDKRLFRYYLNGVDALRLKLWLR